MKVDYEQGKEIAQTHCCGEPDCGRGLVLKWVGDGYEACCTKHPDSDRFNPILSYSQARRQGIPINPYIEEAIKKKEERKMTRDTEIALYKGYPIQEVQDAGTRALAPLEQVRRLIDFCIDFGLELRLRHACLMYGQPYLEVDGMYYLARRTGEYNGLATRPLTIEEKVGLGWNETDYAWEAKCFVKGCGYPFTGWHRIPRDRADQLTKDGRTHRYPMLQEWGDRMCEKQAERHALRKAFPQFPPELGEEHGED